MAILDATYYRSHFFLSLARTFSLPIFLTFVALDLAGVPRFALTSWLAYFASLIAWVPLVSTYTNWANDRHARKLGARPIPRVRGKWPGNLDVMIRLARNVRQGYELQAIGDLFEEYKCDTLNFRTLWTDNIFTRDDIHIRFVHTTGFDHFERGFEAAEKSESFLGKGIFVTDGETWKTHRAMTRPFFNKERISDFETFGKHAQPTLSILTDAAETAQPIDVQDLFARFTLDSASEFLFGSFPDVLSAPRPVPFRAKLGPKGSATDDAFGTFAQAFEDVQVTISIRFRLGAFWPLHELWGDKTAESIRVITKWATPMVEKALRDKQAMKVEGLEVNTGDTTLLGYLANSTDDESTIRFELLNIMMASRDTTAALLTFTIYFLALHPDVATRLRQEVLNSCGPDGIPNYDTFRNMPYMRAVLRETLRLFPPAPLGGRSAKDPALLPASDGGLPMYVPAKSRVNWVLLHLHRRADLWGEDSDEFDPERWLNPQRLGKYLKRPSMFTPFISGPRVCPGQNFAYNEASFMLTQLLQRFSGFELAPDAFPEGSHPPPAWKNGKGRQAIEKCWPATAFTAYVKGGLWIRLKKADH